MKCKLVKLSQFSGEMASIYSVQVANDDGSFNATLFENFIIENKNLYLSELKDLLSRLSIIGHETGARESYFKLYEGKPGDGVCALYDHPDKKLRMYCIRYGIDLIVLGGGGPKDKNMRRFQEDKKLTHENKILRWLSAKITENREIGDLAFSFDYKDFEGNLIIEDDYEE